MNVITKDKRHSAFGISCVAHSFMGFRWDDETFEVPQGSGHKPMTVVSDWAQNKGG